LTGWVTVQYRSCYNAFLKRIRPGRLTQEKEISDATRFPGQNINYKLATERGHNRVLHDIFCFPQNVGNEKLQVILNLPFCISKD